MGSNKDKGTRAETAVVRLARDMGWPYAERRALTGGVDRGDITGIHGVVIQVKDVVKQEIASWQKDTIQQMVNDSSVTCVLVVKKKYKNTRQWDAYIPLYQLLYEAPSHSSNFGMDAWARMDLEHAFKWLKTAGY